MNKLEEPTGRTALLVAAFDSQLKWCARIRDELVARGFTCQAVVPDARSALSPQQILDAGFEDVHYQGWSELIDEALTYDVVVVSLAGPLTQRFSIELALASASLEGPGPVLVSGWVGIIFERITAGYLDRCGTDVIAVNSAYDLEHFHHAADRLGLPSKNLVLTGLPFLSSSPQPAGTGPIRTVLFADQPTVPANAFDRHYIYTKLIEYARAHPDREVLLKPRHRPEEDTFHRMKHHPEDLLASAELPPNFRIDYTSIAEVLPEVDLLLTMSSTACLEAIDFGCRVALILDLGVNERYGNQVFLDSGLLRTFDQVTADDIGAVAPAWRASYFEGRDRPPTHILIDRVEELLNSGERPSQEVQASAYFRSATDLYRAKQASQPAWRSSPWKLRFVRVMRPWTPPIIVRKVRRRREARVSRPVR